MTNRARTATRIGIPVAVVGAIVSALIWLSGRALADESRLSKCEERVVSIVEIRQDIKEMKRDIQQILIKLQHVEDTKK